MDTGFEELFECLEVLSRLSLSLPAKTDHKTTSGTDEAKLGLNEHEGLQKNKCELTVWEPTEEQNCTQQNFMYTSAS